MITVTLLFFVSTANVFGAGLGRKNNFADVDGNDICDLAGANFCYTDKDNVCDCAEIVWHCADEDGDGVCDYRGTGYHDADGLCDYCGKSKENCGRNFIDTDGDGVCDHYSSEPRRQSGTGQGKGFHSRHNRS